MRTAIICGAMALTITAAGAAEWEALLKKLPPTTKAQDNAMFEVAKAGADVAFCPQYKLNQPAVDLLYRTTGAPFKDPNAVKYMQALAVDMYGEHEKALDRTPERRQLLGPTKKDIYCQAIYNVSRRKGLDLLVEK
jgi:hypothetical protein